MRMGRQKAWHPQRDHTMPTSVSRRIVKETRENRGKRAGQSLESLGRAELGHKRGGHPPIARLQQDWHNSTFFRRSFSKFNFLAITEEREIYLITSSYVTLVANKCKDQGAGVEVIPLEAVNQACGDQNPSSTSTASPVATSQNGSRGTGLRPPSHPKNVLRCTVWLGHCQRHKATITTRRLTTSQKMLVCPIQSQQNDFMEAILSTRARYPKEKQSLWLLLVCWSQCSDIMRATSPQTSKDWGWPQRGAHLQTGERVSALTSPHWGGGGTVG